jgi:anti-sigma factor RsiW
MMRDGTCIGVRRRMSAFVDGELDDVAAARVRRHLGGCRRCARVERSLRRVVGGLHDLASRPPPVAVDPTFDAAARLDLGGATDVERS